MWSVARSATSGSHERRLSVIPCTRTRAGPAPATSYAMSTPSPVVVVAISRAGVIPVTPHDTWRAIASRSLAVRMPQNSNPYWCAAVWASIETSVPATAIGSSPAGSPPATCEARVTSASALVMSLRRRTRIFWKRASPSSVAKSITRSTGPVILPEGEEGIDEGERGLEAPAPRPMSRR